MNWEQVEKKAREFSLKFCEDFDISGPTPRVIALEKQIIVTAVTDFALAMMEKQRKADLQMVITALKGVGGRFEWEGWQDNAIEIVETAFKRSRGGVNEQL